jgi:hypothetical protein
VIGGHRRQRPRRRHAFRHRLKGAVDDPPAGRARELAPGLSRTTGSSTMPSNAFRGPASMMCHHIGSRPTNSPASSHHNCARRCHTANASAAVSASTRSAGSRVPGPPGRPPTTSRPPARLLAATHREHHRHNPSATPPCQASADRPIGVRIRTVATSAAPWRRGGRPRGRGHRRRR